MIRTLLAISILGLIAMSLSACGSDGKIDPKVTAAIGNIVTVTCQLDQAVPGLVAAGGAVTVILKPDAAPAVTAAAQVDQILHPVVVAACAAALPNSKPVAVVVTPAVAGSGTQ